MAFSKMFFVSIALILTQLSIESDLYSQEIDWSDTNQAKNRYLAVAPALSDNTNSLKIDADITVTHSKGKIVHRKVQIVKYNTDSLAQYDETDEQGKRIRINMYKKPWYFEIRQYNDSPYVLHAFVNYDDVNAIEGRRYEHVNSVVEASISTRGLKIVDLLSGRNGWVLEQSKRLSDKHVLMSFSNSNDVDFFNKIEVTLSEEFGLAISKSILYLPRPKDWQEAWDRKEVEENEYVLIDRIPMLTKRRVIEQTGLITEFKNIVISKDVDPRRFELSYYGIAAPVPTTENRSWMFFSALVLLGVIAVIAGSIIKRRSTRMNA